MADPRHPSHTLPMLGTMMLALLGLVAPVAAQPPGVPHPVDSSAPITWTSRVVRGWYPEEKQHVFLMIDGFRVTQGEWTLKSRDGVVWLDESDAAGKDGTRRLDIYAEGSVTVTAPGRDEPYETDFLYLTLETAGDIVREGEVDVTRPAEGTPLYQRARQMRARAHAEGQAPLQAEPGPAPEPTDAEVIETDTAEEPGEAPATGGIMVQPLDDIRNVTYEYTERKNDAGQVERINTWTGGVTAVQGDIELRADDLVVWVTDQPDGGQRLEAYLEGHVTIHQADREINASRVYYDFDRQQALIVDARIVGYSSARDVPVYYYADTVRQLGRDRFQAEHATMTTSRMGHPLAAAHGDEFQIVNLSEPAEGDQPPVRRVRANARNVTATVRGVPVFWWPRLAGDVQQGATPLRTIRAGHRDSRGTGIEAQWYLWKLFGIEREPEGFDDIYFNTNVYTERGPFLSAEGEYEREAFYGDFLAAFAYDQGKDRVAGDSLDVPRKERGRVRWQHRQFLPRDWQATFEVSYLSDAQFLREWYEEEDKESKDQETLLHLKKQVDRNSLSILTKGRINDFQTETEVFPRLEHHLIGEPLLGDRLTWFSTNVYEYAHFQPADNDPLRDSKWTNIAETGHEVDLPLAIGPAHVVPFAGTRLAWFQHQVDDADDSGRAYGFGGVRAGTDLWRTYDGVESRLWDLHRLRHINTFEVEARVGESTLDPPHLARFDEPESAEEQLVRGVNDADIYRVGWLQRLQTRRGPPGERKSVDWITFDTAMTWYGQMEDRRVDPVVDDAARPHLTTDFQMQLSDTTALTSDMYYSTDDGQVRLYNVGLAVSRSPRFSYYVGHTYIRGADSALATFGFDYVINRKWKVHFFEQYDFNRGMENTSTRVDLVRRMESWDMTVSVELDPGEDEQIIFVQFQPVGVPELRLGN